MNFSRRSQLFGVSRNGVEWKTPVQSCSTRGRDLDKLMGILISLTCEKRSCLRGLDDINGIEIPDIRT